jgi:hypothetical protein
MTMAANLEQAGFLSYPQMTLQWIANTLDTSVPAFSAAVSPLFEDAKPNDRPVGNWLVLIDALASELPATDVPNVQFNQIVEYVGRMCLAGFVALNEGTITNAQAVALLAAWNTAFGT